MGSNQGYSGVVTFGAVRQNRNDVDKMSDDGVRLVMNDKGLNRPGRMNE